MSVFTALAHEGKWLFRNQRSVVLIAAMVLGVDVALGLIHVVVMVGWDAPNVLRVDMDGSYGEAYQYVKYLWVVVLLPLEEALTAEEGVQPLTAQGRSRRRQKHAR